MATPNEERLAEAWRALDEDNPKPGWDTLPIPSNSTCLLLAGRHHPRNQESLLIGFSAARLPKQSGLPQSKGFSLDTVELHFQGGRYDCLAITRQASASVEIFSAMLDDIIAVLERHQRAESDHVIAVIDRIVGWQRFMSRDDDGLLKGDEELGLLGELQVLRLLLDAGVAPPTALEWWQGPLDSLHDFVAPRGDLEVKASTRTGSFSAMIKSLDQLDETIVQPLYVAAVQFSLSASGTRLPECVQLIWDALSIDITCSEAFERRLLAAGYHQTMASRYHRQFSYLVTHFYEVCGDLPRLTKRNVPLGVLDAVYRVEFDACKLKCLVLADILPHLG